jgi:hypothetical protein
MSDRYRTGFFVVALLFLFLLVAGCTSTTIGDVSYQDGTLLVPVTSTDEISGAFVQVTVYEIRDLHQQELTFFREPVTLHAGTNRVSVPAQLPPGTYKLYVYVLTPGDRQTATIRDIEV